MDICLCASKECPRYENCLRGFEYTKKRKGIYTISYFGETCNEKTNFPDFIKNRTSKMQ